MQTQLLGKLTIFQKAGVMMRDEQDVREIGEDEGVIALWLNSVPCVHWFVGC